MIAVTSPNGKTIAGHAGKCPGFLIFSSDEKAVTEPLKHVKLKRDLVLHQISRLSDYPDHPLQEVKTLITAGCGEGMIRKMALDGIEVVFTEKSDPVLAVQDYLSTQIS